MPRARGREKSREERKARGAGERKILAQLLVARHVLAIRRCKQGLGSTRQSRWKLMRKEKEFWSFSIRLSQLESIRQGKLTHLQSKAESIP